MIEAGLGIGVLPLRAAEPYADTSRVCVVPLDEPWARWAVVAPSFADIFFNNCYKNGILPIVLEATVVDRLFDEVEATPGYRLTIDLPAQTLTLPGGAVHAFAIDASRKHCLLNGLDEIALTLNNTEKIRAYESMRADEEPWLFGAR